MVLEELDSGTRMASVRTSEAFERTRMAADRTLMASMRTAMSMIGFGFTIASVFNGLKNEELLGPRVPENAGALFGLALISLGVLVLLFAILAHARFGGVLRRQRNALVADRLMSADDAPMPRYSLVLAILFLLIGLMAVWIIGLAMLG